MTDNINTNSILLPDILPKASAKKLKVITLALLSVGSLASEWFLINLALYTGKDLLFWIWPTATAMLSIGFLTFFFIVNHNKIYSALVMFSALLAYVLILPKNIFVLAGGILFMLMMLLFEKRIRSEEKSRLDFSIRRVAGSGLNLMIYGFLLLISLNIYYNTSAEFKANPEQFYNQMTEAATRSARFVSGEDRSKIDFNQTLAQFLEAEVEEQYPQFEQLSSTERQQLFNQAVDQFNRQFGSNASIDRPIIEVMAQVAVDRFKATASKYPDLFPLIFTVIIFALLRAFSFIFRWLTVLATWGLFRLLLQSGFFRLSKVPVEVYKLEI